MLHVVVSDVQVDGEYSFTRRVFGSLPEALRSLAAWLVEQAANAAAKLKGSIFEILYRRYVPRLGHNQTIGIIAHKLCRLVRKILHQGIQYEERGPEVKKASKQKRTRKMIQALRRHGYRIEPTPSHSAIPA